MKKCEGGNMAIQGVSLNYSKVPCFRANKQNGYENPIQRRTERNLAILASTGGSALVGVVAGLFSTCFMEKGHGWKIPTAVGLAAGLLTLGLTLPSKIYNTKVNAYAREKEMDVFSRQKSAQSSIYEDIDNEVKDEKVSLDDKVSHYATVKMADNGSGVMIKGV